MQLLFLLLLLLLSFLLIIDMLLEGIGCVSKKKNLSGRLYCHITIIIIIIVIIINVIFIIKVNYIFSGVSNFRSFEYLY